VTSKLAAKFRKDFNDLPEDIQALARQAYRLWRQDPRHGSLRFKQVHPSRPYYSVRIGAHWRAVGEKDGNEITWFWIGPHAEYDGLLRQL
jgi:hypothetical protein